MITRHGFWLVALIGWGAATARAEPPAGPDEAPKAEAGGIELGAYAEASVGLRKVGPTDPARTSATLRRVALSADRWFGERFRAYLEFEWENAIACATCRGLAEVEQAFAEWRLMEAALGLRAGLVLIPMGILNLVHEPTTYLGVNRPMVEQVIIPSTWRELGIGAFGAPTPHLRYQLYLTSAPDPLRLNREGFVDGRFFGSFARTDGLALTGRLEVQPHPSWEVNGSFFAGDMGGNGDFFDDAGSRRALTLPLIGWAVDARAQLAGVQVKALATQFFLPRTGDLLTAHRADGSLHFPDPSATGVPPTRMEGAYVEVAYEVLRHFRAGEHSLRPFVRLETYDTQAAVPAGFTPDPRFAIVELTAGLSYRPDPRLVAKLDLQLRNRRQGDDELLLNGGFGAVF